MVIIQITSEEIDLLVESIDKKIWVLAHNGWGPEKRTKLNELRGYLLGKKREDV